jgi:tetratricopeptide (TPR) repeat protein
MAGVLALTACSPAGPADRELGLRAAADRSVSRFPGDADQLVRRGRLLLGMGKTDEAAADFQRALEASPSPGRFAELGKEVWDAGRPEPALVLWEKGLERFPSDFGLLRNSGLAYYQKGDLARAAERYRSAAEGDPSSLVARTDLAWALLGLGRIAEARSTCSSVLARDPGNSAAKAVLSRIEGQGTSR